MAQTLEAIAKKIAEGKQTDEDMLELAALSATKKDEIVTQTKAKYLKEVLEAITKHELTAEVLTALGATLTKTKATTPKVSSPEIFRFESADKSFKLVKSGLKGMVSDEAIAKLKTHLPTKEEALNYALNDDGKTFVEKLYKPAPVEGEATPEGAETPKAAAKKNTKTK